ncbi:hypothetical protein Btru_067312 [Bulinus truncatus]|nr:hypothetical protein Btru_067312 [Bulinus truncatus]
MLASSANSRAGLFRKQQGWPIQQTARLTSSANGKVGLFSKRMDEAVLKFFITTIVNVFPGRPIIRNGKTA